MRRPVGNVTHKSGLRAPLLRPKAHFSDRHEPCSGSHASYLAPKPYPAMTTRAHFWFRIAAVTAIVAAQFGPRLWAGSGTANSAGAATRVVAASVVP